MNAIELTGHLICADQSQVEIVSRLLPHHIELTRAEAGCLRFDVSATDDPLVWAVSEQFTDKVAFELHQARVRVSDWGIATAGIKREYVITGLS